MSGITAILGSPRRGNTLKLLESVAIELEEAGAGGVDMVHLAGREIEPCLGCMRCLTHGVDECPIEDDTMDILESIRAAEGLILAAPVYVMHIPGPMKILIDRLAFLCHRPELFRTHALVLSTTGAIGLGKALGYLADVASVWGCRSVVKVGAATPPGWASGDGLPDGTLRKVRRAARAFASSLRRGDDYPVSLKSLVQFRMQRKVFTAPEAAEVMPEDYRHYSGLQGRAYPVRAPLSPSKRVAAWVVERFAGLFM
jgi:NAD(P)H-dependent FMN reductase